MLTVPNVYASGPRGDGPEDATQEEDACYINGYDAGFAEKYDKDRADFCKERGGDYYNSSCGFLLREYHYFLQMD